MAQAGRPKGMPEMSQQTRAAEALTRYRLLADHARDIVLFVRRNGRILEANRAALVAYGYPLEELLTLTIQDLRAPETHSLTAQQMAVADTDGILFEAAHRRKDGSSFPVEVNSRGVTVAGERVLLSIVRDITARKQAEAALAERTRQLEVVRAVTIEITQELNLTTLLALIVRRAVDLLGAGGGSIFLWDETTRLLSPQSWSENQEWVSQLRFKLGEGLVGTVAERRAGLIVNDYRHWSEASPLVLAHNRSTAALAEPLSYRDRLMGVICVSNEGTARTFGEEDRKTLGLFAAQAAIAIENANLYTVVRHDAAALAARVQERTQELVAARRQAEIASEAKSEFLAGLSHELRAPLHYIIGFSDLLTMEGYDPLTERQARFLGHIQRSSKHLLQLISDILDFGKIEAGKIDLAPRALPVAQTLEEILTVYRELANKKAQEFRADISPELPLLIADPLRFKQILVNLLSNAVKFTPEHGQIVLAAHQVPTSTAGAEAEGGEGRGQDSEPGPWLEIQVADTGIGIEAANLPRLFQRFNQLESQAARRHGGVGLGLAITKRLVELHGGRIWAQSEGEGRGSTFTIRLPYGGPRTPPEDD
jgi:PAS domain S-box-containing protein